MICVTSLRLDTSDRHHRFVLEGVLDLQLAMDERGIRYAFHLERRSDRHHHLKDLVEKAAAVVTDEMPVPPMKGWIEQLARNADSPVFAVDTSCVVPMLKVGRAHDRAYQYRQATKPMYKERVSRNWQPPSLENHSEFELPFEEIEDVIKYQRLFRMPSFVIARKQGKFWRITEKIFAEEL